MTQGMDAAQTSQEMAVGREYAAGGGWINTTDERSGPEMVPGIKEGDGGRHAEKGGRLTR